ncbi:MAG: hypothetical protein LBK67_00170 [Coriobacteriales bacterium]|jgi:hypothetical protein|nr:hypothetical protein [Coriobacteriales bacterium]
MKTKRNMAITLVCLGTTILTPVSANALAEDAISPETLLHDPLFMLVVFAGFLALGGALIATCVASYRREKISEGAFGGRMKSGEQLDFSGIETPAEIQAFCFADEEGAVVDRSLMDTAPLPAVPGQDETSASGDGEPGALRGSNESDALRDSRDFGDSGNFGDSDEPDDGSLDISEIEEPTEHPLMEFTDDMIQQVIARIEQRRESERAEQQEVRQQQQQSQQQAQAQSQRARQPQPAQQPQPQQQAESDVTARRAEKERGGQPATIEWLETGQKRRGRHFKPAHSRASGDGAKAENLPERPAGMMKHSREQEEILYQRVG